MQNHTQASIDSSHETSRSKAAQNRAAQVLQLAVKRSVAIAVVDDKLKLTGTPADVASIKPHLAAAREAVIEAVKSLQNQAVPLPTPVVPSGGSGGPAATQAAGPQNSNQPQPSPPSRLAALLEIVDGIQRRREAKPTPAQISAVWWLGELADEAAANAGDDPTIDLAGVLVDLANIAWPIKRAVETLAAGPPPAANQQPGKPGKSAADAAAMWLDRVERFRAAWESASWLASTPESIAANLVATWPTFEETTRGGGGMKADPSKPVGYAWQAVNEVSA